MKFWNSVEICTTFHSVSKQDLAQDMKKIFDSLKILIVSEKTILDLFLFLQKNYYDYSGTEDVYLNWNTASSFIFSSQCLALRPECV